MTEELQTEGTLAIDDDYAKNYCPRCKNYEYSWSMAQYDNATEQLCWHCWKKFLNENFGGLESKKPTP